MTDEELFKIAMQANTPEAQAKSAGSTSYDQMTDAQKADLANRDPNQSYWGEDWAKMMTLGLYDPAKNRHNEYLSGYNADTSQNSVLGGVNTNAWNQPTRQDDYVNTLLSSYDPFVTVGRNELSQMLMQQAKGEGDSIAQRQLRAGAEENMRNAASLMASQRGVQGQGQMRSIMNQRSQIGNQLNQDAGTLRLREQMAARDALANLYGQMGAQNNAAISGAFGMDERSQAANIDREKFLAALRQGQAGYDLTKYGMARGDTAAVNAGAANAAKAVGTGIVTAATGPVGGALFNTATSGGGNESVNMSAPRNKDDTFRYSE